MCIAVSFLKILNQKITFRSKETLTTKHVLIYSCQIQQDRADFFVTINSIESNKNTTRNPVKWVWFSHSAIQNSKVNKWSVFRQQNDYI